VVCRLVPVRGIAALPPPPCPAGIAEDEAPAFYAHCFKLKELRALCATAARGGDRAEIRDRLYTFYRWCADANIPELTTLAETIATWWPAIEVFLTPGITNALTEGTNRLIKQVKRAACGFRNPANSARRIRFHCTRKQRAATQTSC
jgi:transposase